MLLLCLGLAGAVQAQLPVSAFTLAWDHSVEKIRWEEDYRVSEQGLRLEQARIRGSGAGMEIPADAVLHDGFWHYTPHLPPLPLLRLGRAPGIEDYELCVDGHCRAMSAWIGPPESPAAAVELWVCGDR